MKDKELEKEIKLDTSFDLLKTDGFDLSSIGIKRKQEEDDQEQEETPIEEASAEEKGKETEEIQVKSDEKQAELKDIKDIFEIANNNVREATNIFNKNIDLKNKF